MRKEKALMLALKIINTCKHYSSQDRCRQCPFNMGGCIVSGEIPSEWEVSEIATTIELNKKGEIK